MRSISGSTTALIGGQSGRFCVLEGQAGAVGAVAQPTCSNANNRLAKIAEYVLRICLVMVIYMWCLLLTILFPG